MNPHEHITSASNPRVRQAARLRDADARRETGLTLIDGLREMSRATAAGVVIEEVFLDTDSPANATRDALIETLAARAVRIVALARKPFEKIAFGSRNEGMVSVARFSARTLESFHVVADRPVLVIEGVEKPGNVGAILRTADAAGIAGVLACDPRTDPANPAVIRASLGTVFTVPLAVATAAATIDWCALHSRRVIAALPTGGVLWHETTLAGNSAILLGSEAHGVSREWREAGASGRLDYQSVRLPMAGSADSLNVSATAAVLCYEAVRQATNQ